MHSAARGTKTGVSLQAKDDNQRLADGELPSDPEADAAVVEQHHSVFGDRWMTLQALAGTDWAKWFSVAPPRRQWLLELPGLDGYTGQRSTGVLPLGKVGMLAAAGGAGKTIALVQLALAVATGALWLETYVTPNPGHVLLALGEEDADELRRRIYYAAKLMRLTDEQQKLAAERITLLPLAGTRVELTEANARGQVTETQALAELRELLRSSGHDWRLTVLDPLSRFAGCDTEKDNAAATRFIAAVETLVDVPGHPTVLLAHHTTKVSRDGNESSASAARGASALTDGVRWVANLDPIKDAEDRVSLTVTKSNYSRKAKAKVFVRDDGGALRPERSDERDERAQNGRKSKPNGARVQDDYAPPRDVD